MIFQISTLIQWILVCLNVAGTYSINISYFDVNVDKHGTQFLGWCWSIDRAVSGENTMRERERENVLVRMKCSLEDLSLRVLESLHD